METRFAEYHGRQWNELVEQGWITLEVTTLQDGTRLAKMGWERNQGRGPISNRVSLLGDPAYNP